MHSTYRISPFTLFSLITTIAAILLISRSNSDESELNTNILSICTLPLLRGRDNLANLEKWVDINSREMFAPLTVRTSRMGLWNSPVTHSKKFLIHELRAKIQEKVHSDFESLVLSYFPSVSGLDVFNPFDKTMQFLWSKQELITLASEYLNILPEKRIGNCQEFTCLAQIELLALNIQRHEHGQKLIQAQIISQDYTQTGCKGGRDSTLGAHRYLLVNSTLPIGKFNSHDMIHKPHLKTQLNALTNPKRNVQVCDPYNMGTMIPFSKAQKKGYHIYGDSRIQCMTVENLLSVALNMDSVESNRASREQRNTFNLINAQLNTAIVRTARQIRRTITSELNSVSRRP